MPRLPAQGHRIEMRRKDEAGPPPLTAQHRQNVGAAWKKLVEFNLESGIDKASGNHLCNVDLPPRRIPGVHADEVAQQINDGRRWHGHSLFVWYVTLCHAVAH